MSLPVGSSAAEIKIPENAGPHQIAFELTRFQTDLLATIARFDEPSGQDLRYELEPRLNRELNHGRLYPNLDGLVAIGLVEKGQQDLRTNSYGLTETGQTVLDVRTNWLGGGEQ